MTFHLGEQFAIFTLAWAKTYYSHLAMYGADFTSLWQFYRVSGRHKHVLHLEHVGRVWGICLPLVRAQRAETPHCTLATDILKTFHTYNEMNPLPPCPHHPDSTVIQVVSQRLSLSLLFFFLCGSILQQIQNIMSLSSDILQSAGDPPLRT